MNKFEKICMITIFIIAILSVLSNIKQETKGYIEGIVDISDEEMLQRIKSDKDYHILEILTKESYMANCYKVGGEDE